jgi:hypothetical protein
VGGAAFFIDALEWVYAEAEVKDAPPSHGGGKLKEVRRDEGTRAFPHRLVRSARRRSVADAFV